MKILIADDSGIAIKVLSRILTKGGHEVHIARNGTEAWDAFEEGDFKVVITDWMMPGIDGVELCRRIRNANRSHYVYIIILTAKGHHDDTVHALEAGADDFIVKPFSASEMLARLRSCQRIIELETRYKEASVQLLQSEKMASIGALAAGMAHEINNPMGFLSSNLKTLGQYAVDVLELLDRYRTLVATVKKGQKSPEAVKQVRGIGASIAELESRLDVDYLGSEIPQIISESTSGAQRIQQIIQNLRAFAHPGEEMVQSTDLHKGLDSTLTLLKNELLFAGVTVSRAYKATQEVGCFPQQINQVFMNIFMNALEAMEKGGTLTIRSQDTDAGVSVSISDTGCGIAPDNLPRVFDPFFTTKDVGQGTGLGMNVAFNIVQKHSGTLSVESRPGEGTTFTLTLPVPSPLSGSASLASTSPSEAPGASAPTPSQR